MDQTSKEGRLFVQVVSTGGEGFADLSALLKKDSNSQDSVFHKVLNDLADYISKFNKTNPAPLGFHVGPMLGYSEAKSNLWNQQKLKVLETIVEEYRADDHLVNDYEAIVRHQDPRWELYSPSQMDEIDKARPKLQTYVFTLAKLHEDCKAARITDLSKCGLPQPRPNTPSFVEPILPPSAEALLVVDGKRWSGPQSRAVFEDPSATDSVKLIDLVHHRDPGAKSAHRVFVLKSNYILDATLSTGNDNKPVHQFKVFYPSSTKGDQLERRKGEMSLLMGLGWDDPNGDFDLQGSAVSAAAFFQCAADGERRQLTGAADVYLTARDILGQIAVFKMVHLTFGWRPEKWGFVTLEINGQKIEEVLTNEMTYAPITKELREEDPIGYDGCQVVGEAFLPWGTGTPPSQIASSNLGAAGHSPVAGEPKHCEGVYSNGARHSKGGKCQLCSLGSDNKPVWTDVDKQLCQVCSIEGGQRQPPKDDISDCMYDGVGYGDLSYWNGGAKCQQCQKGNWVDVDCQRCTKQSFRKSAAVTNE